MFNNNKKINTGSRVRVLSLFIVVINNLFLLYHFSIYAKSSDKT